MDPLEAQLRRQIERSRHFFWHRLRWRFVASRLPAGKPIHVLDVGAGAGLIGEYLERYRPKATYRFIEPIESLEKHLEKRFGVEANARDLASYEPMDVVTLLDVLEHQRDDHSFVTDLVGRMRPGARLVLTVPALQGLWSAWDVGLGHHRRYTKPSLQKALTDSAGRIEEITYLFPELVPAAFLRRLRRPAQDGTSPTAEEFQFPEVPGWVNGLLYAVGSVTLSMRRIWPFGTSLAAVIRRTDGPIRSDGA
ncbi:MAG: class I SAM-dependent methyltransferase [Pseudonocardiaceae bacterium]